MPRTGSPYGGDYPRQRAALLAGHPTCEVCRRAPADSADHDPPLYLHEHRPGTGCCRLRPLCLPCNIRHTGGWAAVARVRRAKRAGVDLRVRPIPPPSRQW